MKHTHTKNKNKKKFNNNTTNEKKVKRCLSVCINSFLFLHKLKKLSELPFPNCPNLLCMIIGPEVSVSSEKETLKFNIIAVHRRRYHQHY